MKAINLDGGEGTRLRQYTYSLPKPLIPIGREKLIRIIRKIVINLTLEWYENPNISLIKS